ncbi:MAG: hypothetical protein A2Z58_05135 [Planctomycetes bacterium RIFCSPHIGHO2_12_42_15]|nr:MAG: hypothetical protein A2Z58_05135 [Planctomycetes bacterium RIFCSPHIGHO2_12_42_15]
MLNLLHYIKNCKPNNKTHADIKIYHLPAPLCTSLREKISSQPPPFILRFIVVILLIFFTSDCHFDRHGEIFKIPPSARNDSRRRDCIPL